MLNYDSGEIKNIHYGDILIKYPSILDIRKEELPFITKGTLEKYKENLLENGDLIFADAAEDETVGKAEKMLRIVFSLLFLTGHCLGSKEIGVKNFVFYYLKRFHRSRKVHEEESCIFEP